MIKFLLWAKLRNLKDRCYLIDKAHKSGILLKPFYFIGMISLHAELLVINVIYFLVKMYSKLNGSNHE